MLLVITQSRNSESILRIPTRVATHELVIAHTKFQPLRMDKISKNAQNFQHFTIIFAFLFPPPSFSSILWIKYRIESFFLLYWAENNGKSEFRVYPCFFENFVHFWKKWSLWPPRIESDSQIHYWLSVHRLEFK